MWEEVEDSEETDTFRMKVDGGWLYRVRQWRISYDSSDTRSFTLAAQSVVFVPQH